MDIHHFSRTTSEYLGKSTARPDPLSAGDFLVPAYSTPAPAPASGKNEVAVFEKGAWVIKPDFRGTVYWLADGSRHTIAEIGALKPAGALGEAPKANPAPELLAPLTRFRFEMILELLGITQEQVFTQINALDWTDRQKLVARKKVETGGNDGLWSRENSLWELLGPSLGVTKEQIDAKWKEAQAL